jgi:signal transduction histidine kinase
VATRGLTLEAMEVELADAQGLIGRTIQTKQANISKDLSPDSDLMGIKELQSCKSAYCVPLQNQGDIFGVLLVAAHEEDYFAKPQQELLNLIGEQISISIKKFYDRQNLEFQIDLLNELRRKTARELHDGLTQVVAALAMRANFARRMMEVNPEATEEELNKVEELARVTTKEIRQMIFSLQPSEIDSVGLKIAIETIAGKFGDLFDLEVSILFDQDIENLIPINGQRVIYSLIEESINIIRKNGGPKRVELRLREFENGILLLEIEGKGRKGSTYELDQMNGEFESLQATAELIKATLQVDTNLEYGSCLRFYIPQAEVPI